MWAQAAPGPLVIFLDEIDALRDEVLISVLRQLRAGYRSRPQESPYGAPAFRLTYTLTGPDTLEVKFAISPSGKSDAFKPYLSGTCRRKTAGAQPAPGPAGAR